MQVEQYCFRCDDLLESVTRLARPLAQAKGLTFTTDIALDLVHNLKGDPVKIKQVLINLLTNGNIARAVAGEKIGTLVTT
jgi:signal transduction histidine kinase